MNPEHNKTLGEILSAINLLLPEQLEAALERQQQSGRRLGQVLIDMGLISRDEVMQALLAQTGIPHVHLRKGLIDPKVTGLIPRDKAESLLVVPLFKVHNTLTLAMLNATDVLVIDDIESMTGCKVYPVQCRREEIEWAVREYYREGMAMEDFIESFRESDVQISSIQLQDLKLVEEEAEGARVINLVNIILLSSIREGASDVHIEPDTRTTRIRFRIDGVLQEVMTPPGELHQALISRIKVMARMDIAERRVPQDGRIHVSAEGKQIDVRVSTMPTVLAEKVVMRLLDKERLQLDLNKLGFFPETLVNMKALLDRPHGIMLVTGPTGSGKTTTLYSALNYLSSIEKNICTIEDPVEYQIPLVNQIQVSDEQQLTFARTLRSLLRQDPDVLMVGEIRDAETAQVSIQAALTGHLVLATLHTNDSASSIPRLAEMGIEPYLLASTINGILAQRLVRLVCENCKTTYFPPPDLLERIGWKGKNTTFIVGQGCDRCFDSGMRHRRGIYELLTLDEPVRDLILQGGSLRALRDTAIAGGMMPLKADAFRLVEEGLTSLEEVMRVVLVELSARRAERAVA